MLPPSRGDGHTGTVFVLPSPDGQRSFLSYFESEKLVVSASLKNAIRRSRLVVIEGYLWELPNAEAAIAEVVATAQQSGAKVVLTAGDRGVVALNRGNLTQALQAGGKDILIFSNKDEACELLGTCPLKAADAAVALGSMCSISVVTDGPSGSYVSCMGQVHHIAPVEGPQGVVDTCGAGDAYAAGFCYALMMGHDCQTAGRFASSTAAQIIQRHGAQLMEDEAERLVGLLPDLSVSDWLKSSFSSSSSIQA